MSFKVVLKRMKCSERVTDGGVLQRSRPSGLLPCSERAHTQTSLYIYLFSERRRGYREAGSQTAALPGSEHLTFFTVLA